MKLKAQLFLLSFLTLFLELTLIRWAPANFRLLGYFSNLILIASFLGMGLGILLRHIKLPLITFFPLVLSILIAFIYIFRVELNIASSEVLFFNVSEKLKLEPEYILPVIFLLTSFCFIPLSAQLGRIFAQFKPLQAYTIDILGALSGIVLFSLFSYFSVPAFVWFILILLTSLLLTQNRRSIIYIGGLVVLIGLTAYMGYKDRLSTWSPYYKLDIFHTSDGYALTANKIGHQFITHYEKKEPFYFPPYTAFKDTNYKNILIVGAGTGTDTAIALAKDPTLVQIDAVDIDPKIIDYGKKLNPDRPFEDKRVNIIVDDARHYMEKTTKKYDLIVYALPDSLTVVGNTSNIRLESFLFTKESFSLAKGLLSENGLLTLYNYYREDWLMDKIAMMLKEVFAQDPYIATFGANVKAASFMVGPKTSQIQTNDQIVLKKVDYRSPLASDDWPFLYVKEHGIPFFYLKFLVTILALSVGLVLLTFKLVKTQKFDLQFFFFGAAFLLLETKSLVSFGLLFGTTWLVNSLVIAGILVSILIANILSSHWEIGNKKLLYLLLIGLLVANYFTPVSYFLHFEGVYRYVLAAIFYFSPVFVANILFSQTFKHSSDATDSFGSNILGAVLGGLLEYTAMISGYQNLLILIALFYVLSLIKFPSRIFRMETH